MVMSYTKTRELESTLQEKFGDDVIKADVTGGLPDDPDSFDLEEAKDEFEAELDEDEDKDYDGPDPEGDPWIEVVQEEQLLDVIRYLKDQLNYGTLHCLSGDHLAEEEQLMVIYHLYSIEDDKWATLKVKMPEDSASVPSISGIFPSADWHEREAYDMLGIRFEDHPDLRRILLPNDWDGHPLRKDYEFPLYYRGLPVDWDEARENRMSRDDFYDEAEELEEMDIDRELGFTPKSHKENGF